MFACVSRCLAPAALGLLLAAPVMAQETAKPLWSGRFDVEPDKALLAWGASFSFDRRLFEDDVTGSLAWAEALTRAGVLTADESSAIRRGLTSIIESARANPAFLTGPDEDVHSFVERVLIERVGEPGRRLHTGRSRNDQVAVDMRLYVRRRVPDIQKSLRSVIDALVAQAASAGDAVMPSYTHVRRAQPVLVAHYLLAHAYALRRDVDRFEAVRAEADAMPLGAGAIAGTNYDVDTRFLAERLGFSKVVANSIDATSDRDYVSSFLHASSLAMVHLSRLAEDVVLFTGEEFGFFVLSDAVATGSSLMPQKKNPDPMELVRGKAGRTIGNLAGFMATDERPAERVQQGPAGGQGGTLRRGRLADGLGRSGGDGGAHADAGSCADHAWRVGLPALDRRGRLPRLEGRGVPHGPRGPGWAWCASCSSRARSSRR
jgi:argininosuccinate lyase